MAERLTEERESEAKSVWPKISLVTPVYNSANYLEETIHSVLAQNYPNLEYIIVDGGSTDGSVEIIRKYESRISGWISEPDNGMYDALNKGFQRTSGELMGWISATDLLHLGGLRVVGSVFRDFPRIEWITGRATWFNEQGMTVGVLDIPRWSRYRFLAGANRYIQQESTYWRRSLWEKAGSRTESSCRNGADFELWIRFFRHARLYSVDALIGGYRLHRDALGFQDLEAICRTHDAFIEADLETAPWGRFLRLVRRISQSLQRVPKIRALWNRAILPGLYRLPGPDIPPVIRYRYDQDQWKINR